MKTLLSLILTAALLLPGAAFAMPIDNGPTPSQTSTAPPPPPQVHTIVRETGDTLAIVLAGVAVAVAIGSAAYTALRLRREHAHARDAVLVGGSLGSR
jgi:uncharacterized protein HemX